MAGNKAGEWSGGTGPPSRWRKSRTKPGWRSSGSGGRTHDRVHDWQDIRAELDDGDADSLAEERARTEAWVSAFHLAEERKRLGLTQREVADLMGVTPGRVSQIENGDLDVNEVATLSRYAQALGARMRIIFDYGNDLRQIAQSGDSGRWSIRGAWVTCRTPTGRPGGTAGRRGPARRTAALGPGGGRRAL
ncbi:helix-turn-helix domain-containing protein [Dactylosporangium sp. McL0621]|uniref:helix-turn-helix domain-containing protein n=1 Tax=Dactylosporangium sp. McL0621 TaxID=3415678 RepID=UPI003CEE00BC